MVVTLAKKTLRAVQNALSIYEALPPTYAEDSSFANLSPPSNSAYVEEFLDLGTFSPRNICLGGLAAVVHADHMEGTLLDRGRWLGQLGRKKTT